MRSFSRSVLLSAFACLTACDPGYVEVVFTWAGGRPTFPDEANVTKTMLIQERTDPKIPGRDLVPPQTLPFAQSFSEIEEVPYGKSCVAVGEVHLGKDVIYYGISNIFTVERGQRTTVSVYLEPTQPPQPLPAELGASLVIVTSTSAPGYVNRPDVALLITAPVSAEKVRLSNVVGLPEGKSQEVALSTLETIDGAPDGYRSFRLGSWNLERDVEEECLDRNRCRREVFAAFLDAQQYAGPPVLASVILDQVPPSLLIDLTSVVPEAAREESFIVVNLTANEVVREPVLAIAQRVELPFVRVSPSDDAPTASYTFTSSRTAGSIGRNDVFLIRATLRDLAGNVARDVEVGAFRVDTVLPTMSEVVVTPSRINDEVGGLVTASFTLNKAARYTVTITGRPMDSCRETGRPPALRVTCVRAMRGDEITQGEESSETLSIDAEDDAMNIARRVNVPLTFDFKDPLLFAATFTPESSGNELVQLALITDEPLEEGFVPELLWAGLPAPFEHDPARDRPYERYFVLAPPIDIPRGEYVLSGVTLRDEALNEAIATSTLALPRRWLFDPDAPSIENLVVAVQGGAPVIPPRVPAIAGSVVEIDFVVREEHPAFVRVLLGTRDITTLCTSSGVPVASWHCAYVTTGVEFPLGVEEGESVLVEAGDASGGRRSLTAPIIWDYAPPSLQSVSISPEAAGIGTSAQLTLAVSEPLAPGFEPPLSFSPALAFVFDAGRSTAFQPVYQYSVPLSPAMPSSTFVLNEVRLRDVAGNEALVTGTLGTLLIDNVAPQINGLTVVALTAPFPATPPRINGIPGQQIEVRFAVNEVSPATAVPSVLLGSIDLSAGCVAAGSAPIVNWTCRYVTTGAEVPANTEQTSAVVVELFDLSGNRVSETASVVFDYLPPSIQSVAIDPAATGLGRSALLTLAASEPLAPGFEPVLFWSPVVSFVYESARSTQFQHVFRYDVTATDVPRRYVLERARLLDLAGNQATVVLSPPLTWLLDNVPPVISNVTVDVGAAALNLPETTPPRINGDPARRVRVRFTVTEENAGAAPRVMIGAVDASASCTSSGSGAAIDWTCLYAMTGREAPGLQIISVQAADLAENTASDASAAVVFDFDPPQIVAGSESFQLFPATTNFLTRLPGPRIELTAWGLGTTGFVGFVFDEPLARTPQVLALPSAFAFQLSQESGTAFTFEYEMTAASRQGAHRVEVSATDAAGNAVVRTLATSIEIDTLPPAAPNTLRMTHTRVPWGSDATGDGPHAMLSADSGAVEAGARVVVLGSESLGLFEVLGSALADGTGALASFELDRRDDRAEIFVVALDGAGNNSPSVSGDATRASRVRRGEWIASLRGKVPGRRSPNPHDAEMYTGLLPTLAQNPDQTIELNAADFARMAATDGQTLNVQTVRRFEPMPTVLDQPSPRERAAMAYDSMRGRAVLFGGRSPETLGDTWEWDGRRWFSVVGTGIPPPIRSGASMVFDAARGVVLMFGGADPLGTVRADTWAWDGESWSEVTSAVSPPPRQFAAMAYDPERARVVLYGGTDSGGPRRDTWIWDGVSWAAAACTFNCPAARAEGALVWNGGAARLQLMGGVGAGGALDASVWAYETSWRSFVLPQPQPSARRGGVYVYDPVRSAIVQFGGTNGQHLADTWVGNRQVTFGVGQDRPAARTYAASAFDVRRGEVLVFGGVTGAGPVGDTWTFDGERWRDVTPAQAQPEPRSQHAMAFDTASREVLMFGGVAQQSRDFLNDTWSWNGARWKQHAPLLVPFARSEHVLTSWSTGAAMFGGGDQTELVSNIPHLWNGETWIADTCRVPNCLQPEERTGHAMAYDSALNKLTIFGGLLENGQLDTRVWEKGVQDLSWTPLIATGPTGRRNHAMVFDSARGLTVMFGGLLNNVLDDLWEWDGVQWIPRNGSGNAPGPRELHAMTYDSVRGRTLLHGGQGLSGDALADVWEWDGAAWYPLNSTLSPGLRRGHQIAYDPDRRSSVVFGGEDSDSLTWELDADPNQRAASLCVFDVADLSLTPLIFDLVEMRATAGGGGSTVTIPGSGSSVTGVEIGIWDTWRAEWQWLSANAAAPNAPTLSVATRNANTAAVVDQDQRIRFVYRSAEGIGNGAAPAQLGIDSVELRIAYRHPN